ncbi:MAG: NAD(P)H-binding protein, partial [Proteobacteria bacterium]|nr:NAD(P)H-binding protein [Pseudomonadota bacterium]
MFAVLGAAGKTGRYLVERLCADGHDVIAVGRSRARLEALGDGCRHAIADFDHPVSVAKALIGARRVVNLVHARHTGILLDCLPTSCERLVLIGSTRRFTTLPDPAADEVRAAETLFLSSGVTGVMLHPSMIYGAPDDRNVNRILRYLKRWPKWLPVPVPLPAGGRRTVQPVFVDDVV